MANALSLEAERRVAVALLFQPVVAGLLGFAFAPLVNYASRVSGRGHAVDLLDMAIAFGLGTGIAGLLVTIFGAFPALMWLLKRGPITRPHALIAGIVLGSAPGAFVTVLSGAHDSTYGIASAVYAVLFGSLIGGASAEVFWWMAGRYVKPAARSL